MLRSFGDATYCVRRRYEIIEQQQRRNDEKFCGWVICIAYIALVLLVFVGVITGGANA